jgi:hypothetical protein
VSEALAVSSVRVEEVKQRISQLKSNLVENMLELGELFSEAKHNEYPQLWGHNGFDDWLDASGLDVSRRTAYYLIKIVDNSRQLGIGREQLAKTKISHLKEIFTLNPETRADDIKLLVDKCPEMSLDEVRDAIGGLRQKDGEERLTWRNFRLTDSQAEVVDSATERAKLEFGQTIDSSTGEIMDISDGQAVTLICGDYLAGPDPMMAAIEAMPE